MTETDGPGNTQKILCVLRSSGIRDCMPFQSEDYVNCIQKILKAFHPQGKTMVGQEVLHDV